MSKTLTDLLKLANSEVGYLEKKDGNLAYLYDKTKNAGYNNYTKYGYEMHKIYPAVMDYPASWCDCFIDWLFYTVFGVSTAKSLLGGNFDDYTVNSAKLYNNYGAYYKSNPKVGDQIFFKNATGICHTGLVIGVTASTVTTIEGNTSGASGVVANGGGVKIKSYPINYSRIDGYGRPDYNRFLGSGSTQSSTSTKIQTSISFSKTVQWYGYANVTSELNVRRGAGTNYAQLTSYPSLKRNTKVGICDSTKSSDGSLWYYIEISGDKGTKYGFVSAELISKNEVKSSESNTESLNATSNSKIKFTGTVNATSLNVRTYAGTQYHQLKSYPSIKYGTKVDVIYTLNDSNDEPWYYILINKSVYGFVKAKYITKPNS